MIRTLMRGGFGLSEVIIVGGGAAGMICACEAAKAGHRVTLIEKNEKLGKKIYITGKGRGNLTNAGDQDTLMKSVVSNPKFLYSAFGEFNNFDTMDYFTNLGLKIKVERGGRVFPESDHAYEITDVLKREMNRLKVKVVLNTAVTGLITEQVAAAGVAGEAAGTAADEEKDLKQDRWAAKKKNKGPVKKITGVLISRGPMSKPEELRADAVVLATGGLSYPSTGSTGDGHRWAVELGLAVTDTHPALVAMKTKEDFKDMAGLSLKNCAITVFDGTKKVYEDFGEMLFTHTGVSGPMILSASSHCAKRVSDHELSLKLDLKPALDRQQLDARILRDWENEKNRDFENSLSGLLPRSIIPAVVKQTGITPVKKVHDITKEEREKLVEAVKAFAMTLTGLEGYEQAIITQGGVNVSEINPKTMESKKVSGLFVVGELLDVDAVTGGFNLTIAWSTGVAAGRNIR